MATQTQGVARKSLDPTTSIPFTHIYTHDVYLSRRTGAYVRENSGLSQLASLRITRITNETRVEF